MRLWSRRSLVLCILLIPILLLCLVATPAGLRGLLAVGNRLTADILTIGSGSGCLLGTVILHDIRYDDGIDTVTIDRLEIAWEPLRLLSGDIRLREVKGAGVRVLLGESGGETVLSPFSMPIDLFMETMTVNGVAILADDQELWAIRTATVDNLAFQGQTMTVATLAVESEPLTITAGGQLRTADDYPVEITTTARFQAEGFTSVTVQGTIKGALNALHIEAEGGAPVPAQLSGRLDNLLGATSWRVRLESQQLTPAEINTKWPTQRFTNLIVEGHGSLEEYFLDLGGQVDLPPMPQPSTFTAQLEGNGDGLAVKNLHLGQGKGRLAARGALTWSPTFSWQAEINATHLDPSLLASDWPGDLTAALTTSGRSAALGLAASVHLTDLRGTLRGYPLSGKGCIDLDGSTLRIPNLAVQSGGSSLRINGTAAEQLDLTLLLDSTSLAELWPGARGSVQARGHLTGPRSSPQSTLSLTGSKLGLDEGNIKTLRAEARGSLIGDGPLAGSILAEGIHIGALAMEQIRLQLTGSPARHSLELVGRGPDLTAGLTLDGALTDHRWQGTLRQTYFISQHHDSWRQQQPTQLVVAADTIDLKPLCLAAPSSATLCAHGSWQGADGTWQTGSTISALPLSVLHDAGLIALSPGGLVNLNLELTGQHARLLSAQLKATGHEMSLRVPLTDGGSHQITWKKNVLEAGFAANRLQAMLESTLTDDSLLRVDWASTVTTLAPDAILRAPMTGSFRFALHDLRPLAWLSDQMILPTGSLQGQGRLSGTPATPVFNGDLELLDGAAEIPPLGITLSPLAIKINGDANNVHLAATAHSGSGTLSAGSTLHLDRLATGPHTLKITGEGFQAARLPGLELDITPDLQMEMGLNRIEARGTVTIPRARLTSIDFNQAIAPSGDMVVIDDPQPDSPMVAQALHADITVIAGDDVRVDAHGLRGTITGRLAIKSQPGRPPLGNGTLSVHKGSFTVYGRRLGIDLGRLLFSGGPLTNPGIELRSERKTARTTSGVIVDGFLQRPEMHFYSTPAMEQSAIVTHLLESTAIGGETRDDVGVIGTAADKIGLGGMVPYLQGVKKLTMIDEIKLEAGDESDSYSLVFGSWLTPDFYVSYGKDLVNESASFNTRYTLGKGFSFLTETGPAHSGGDIIYTFEH